MTAKAAVCLPLARAKGGPGPRPQRWRGRPREAQGPHPQWALHRVASRLTSLRAGTPALTWAETRGGRPRRSVDLPSLGPPLRGGAPRGSAHCPPHTHTAPPPPAPGRGAWPGPSGARGRCPAGAPGGAGPGQRGTLTPPSEADARDPAGQDADPVGGGGRPCPHKAPRGLAKAAQGPVRKEGTRSRRSPFRPLAGGLTAEKGCVPWEGHCGGPEIRLPDHPPTPVPARHLTPSREEPPHKFFPNWGCPGPGVQTERPPVSRPRQTGCTLGGGGRALKREAGSLCHANRWASWREPLHTPSGFPGLPAGSWREGRPWARDLESQGRVQASQGHSFLQPRRGSGPPGGRWSGRGRCANVWPAGATAPACPALLSSPFLCPPLLSPSGRRSPAPPRRSPRCNPGDPEGWHRAGEARLRSRLPLLGAGLPLAASAGLLLPDARRPWHRVARFPAFSQSRAGQPPSLGAAAGAGWCGLVRAGVPVRVCAFGP